jgi:AcrR family transcriptional regulator
MSPRSKEQIDQIRKQSIVKILEAAFQLMAKNGYEATSISQIAKRAGISKGLMYNYFNSKEDLLKELINNAFAEGDQLMEEIMTEDPRETMENIFRWYFKEMRERPEHWRLITELTLKIDKFDFVREAARNKLWEYAEFLGGLLEQMGFEHPKEEAQLIAGLFDGIGVQYLVVGEDYPLDEMEKYLIEKYCRK